MGKKIRFSQKYEILGLKKIIFQECSNFSESFGLILLVPLAFWKLLIWPTVVAHLIKKLFQRAFEQKKKFESITYSVKQWEHVFAFP